MRFLAIATCLTLLIAVASPDDGRRGDTTVRATEITPGAEQAIQKGLDYLAKAQAANGSWKSSAPVATTSMCCLALMASGLELLFDPEPYFHDHHIDLARFFYRAGYSRKPTHRAQADIEV